VRGHQVEGDLLKLPRPVCCLIRGSQELESLHPWRRLCSANKRQIESSLGGFLVYSRASGSAAQGGPRWLSRCHQEPTVNGPVRIRLHKGNATVDRQEFSFGQASTCPPLHLWRRRFSFF